MEYFASLILFTLVTLATPGPNNLMIMTSGLNFGVRASIPHYLGIVFGFPLMIFMVGYCLGDLMMRSEFLRHSLQVGGILYLSWLAWKIASAASVSAKEGKAQPFTLWQSLIFQWLNVKGWVIVVALVASFVSPANLFHDLCFACMIYLVFGMVNTFIWLGGGYYLRRWLNEPVKLRVFNVSMAVILLVSLLPIISEEWMALRQYFSSAVELAVIF